MLNKKIENLLKSNKKYISEKNEILKAKVYEDAVNINKELIELLFSDSKVKETYFTEINGILVFDKQGFLNFLESKDFLPDSYTAFKNKIGLTDRNGNYLSDNDDVVLSFPYKDCVLVGGQDKDDQKREEKMYNEILASEEISTLFSPKVLTNIKRFGKISSQSVSQSDVIFSENDNLIIKGNNLIALASLLKRYEGKVKCIYIDPPYNTGNDSFGYNDRFNHSTWLVFMKNRLELAKRLLSDDGIIFVQIDNSPSSINESPEFGYILVLMDEVFGRKNYITTFTWKKKGNSSNTKDDIGTITESILMYSRKVESIEVNLQEYKRKYKYTDEEGMEYNLEEPLKTNLGEYERKTMKFEIKTPYGNFLPPKGKRWTLGKEKMQEIVKKGKYAVKDNKFYIKKYSTDYKKGEYKLYNNLLLKHSSLKGAKGELSKLGFQREKFSSPKPEILIKRIFEISTQPDDLVLDFYLGSGTTAAVAHKMGRRYIGIEQMDYIENIAVKRLKKVIDGEQTGISKTVNWQGGGSFVYCELKENGQKLIDSILSSDEKSIDEIKEKIFSDDRIVPYITKQELEKVDKDFLNLKLEEKKKVLMDLVDKNKLYINYSDIDNEEYDISKEEKQFNNSFYKDVK